MNWFLAGLLALFTGAGPACGCSNHKHHSAGEIILVGEKVFTGEQKKEICGDPKKKEELGDIGKRLCGDYTTKF